MDKRVYPRKEFTVPVDFAAAGRPYQRNITNISLGGMLIRSKEHFEPGSTITLCYNVSKDIHVKTKAVVVHSGEEGLGVEFMKNGDEESLRSATRKIVTFDAPVKSVRKKSRPQIIGFFMQAKPSIWWLKHSTFYMAIMFSKILIGLMSFWKVLMSKQKKSIEPSKKDEPTIIGKCHNCHHATRFDAKDSRILNKGVALCSTCYPHEKSDAMAIGCRVDAYGRECMGNSEHVSDQFQEYDDFTMDTETATPQSDNSLKGFIFDIDQLKALELIKHWKNRGWRAVRIAVDLNAKGLKGPNGEKWSTDTVRKAFKYERLL